MSDLEMLVYYRLKEDESKISEEGGDGGLTVENSVCLKLREKMSDLFQTCSA